LRIGHNPLSDAEIPARSSNILTVITHLPDMKDEYHAGRFEVMKACLLSMRKQAGEDYDFQTLVWDNGSCAEWLDWVSGEYDPDYLVCSRNIGKWSARAAILRMFPPSYIINISDDDMLYYPEWFARCMKIYDTYPNAGMITGYPVRTAFRWGCAKTIAWARKNADVKAGDIIPKQWDVDFCASIGREYENHPRLPIDQEYMATYKGVSAYLTSHHCQFICKAGRIAQYSIWDNKAMTPDRMFDEWVDNAGLLRLATTERLTRHIGNVLDGDIKSEIEKYNLI
jgi:glycosyltransferase involved in cell wall biosynthesis